MVARAYATRRVATNRAFRDKRKGGRGVREARPGRARRLITTRGAPHRGFGRRTGRRNAKNKGFLASALRCYATRQGGGAWCSCFVVVVVLHYWRGVLVLVRLAISEEKNTCLGFIFFCFCFCHCQRDKRPLPDRDRRPAGQACLTCAVQRRSGIERA